MIETHELDAIKRAAAEAIAEAGTAAGVPRDYLHPIAAFTLDAIDRAAEDPTDPRPFAPGSKVRVKGTGIPGVVQRAVEDQGEVHTVWVKLALDEAPAAIPMSPRELEAAE